MPMRGGHIGSATIAQAWGERRVQQAIIRHGVTPAIFDAEIRDGGVPVVMPGVAQHWPLVRAAAAGDAASNDAVAALLSARASDALFEAVRAAPEEAGRLHYRADMRGLNFVKGQATLPQFLHALLAEARAERPATLAGQGLVAERYLPDFASDHPLALIPPDVTARLWIGNAARVATHNDPSDNIAIVAAGRRRFTLFPPDQLGNLYMGPFHLTPAGTPVSMVHVSEPDLARYPRFAAALEQALVADLAPGDGLFIPYHWYHHVEALAPLNILVNYWWNVARSDLGSPWDALLHGMMSLRGLPPQQRAAWQAMFNHYVFLNDGDPAAHLPAPVRGVLAADNAEDIAAMRATLMAALTKQQRG